VACAFTGWAVNGVILKGDPSAIDRPMAAGASHLATHRCRSPFSDRMSLHTPSKLEYRAASAAGWPEN